MAKGKGGSIVAFEDLRASGRLIRFKNKHSSVPASYDPTEDQKTITADIKKAQHRRLLKVTSSLDVFMLLPPRSRSVIVKKHPELVPPEYDIEEAKKQKTYKKRINDITFVVTERTHEPTVHKESKLTGELNAFKLQQWYIGTLLPQGSNLFSEEFNPKRSKNLRVFFKVLDNAQRQFLLVSGTEKANFRFVSFELGCRVLDLIDEDITEKEIQILEKYQEHYKKTLEPLKSYKYDIDLE